MNDARGQGDLVASKAEWIAAAVGALVMQLDDRQVRRQERDRPQDARAERRVALDLLEFLRR